MARDRKNNAQHDQGDARNPALKTYLEALREARQSGADDYQAADIAERATVQRHGRMPKEGK